MGRIRTTLVKRVANKLFEEHPDTFGADFYKNKQEAETILKFPTPKLRNKVAGYLTRLYSTKSKRSREKRE